jgi:hypothetical protein
MYRVSNFFILMALIFCAHSGFAQIKNQKISGQSFSGDIIVNSSSDRVWDVLTDVIQLTEILDYEYTGGTKKFNKVGDEAEVKVWGDASSFILIRSNTNKELRFNLDPENGTYICNCRWILTKSGNGTKVSFEERYTESSPQTKEDLESQVKEANEMLKRLKMKVE